MKILILTEAFPPETKSCSTLFFELAESLVRKGHKVSVVTRMPRYNVADGTDLGNIPAAEAVNGIEVKRLRTPPLARTIPYIRGVEHFLLGWIFFWGGLLVEKHDIILIYSPPLTLGISAYLLSLVKRAKFVSNIQDLYPQTVIDLGLLKNKFLVWVSRAMEALVYKKSDALTVHSEGNKAYVVSRGTAREKVAVIHNWVDTDSVCPGNRENAFSARYNLKDKFIVSFGGVMGFAQGLEVVIKTADLLRKEENIHFILVGDGTKRPELEKMAVDSALKNIQFIPTQSREIYPQVLHASDICLVTLGKELVTPVVPSKIFSIMAAGKPVLASLPLLGDAPKILEKYHCGIAVEAGKADSLANAVLKLYNDKKLCDEMGKNGRAAAIEHFSRSACVKKYADLFESMIRE